MMLAMDLKWVELPDCKEKGQGDGDQIQLVFSDGGQPENGTVATCKPRMKNNENIWEEKKKAEVVKAKNATANASGNATAKSNSTNGTNVTNATTAATLPVSNTTKA